MTAQPYTPAEEAAIRAWLDDVADEGRISGRDELRRALATLDAARAAPDPVGLRESIIRAVAKINGYDHPNTDPGGWWDKLCAPVVAAALALPSMPPGRAAPATPASLDVERRWRFDGFCEVTDADHEHGAACAPFTPHSHRPGDKIKWAREWPVDDLGAAYVELQRRMIALGDELAEKSAATPAPLDVAWAEAEAALDKRADWWRIRSLTEVAFAPMRWEVVATDGNRIVKAEGHDPAAALRALAARLAATEEKPSA